MYVNFLYKEFLCKVNLILFLRRIKVNVRYLCDNYEYDQKIICLIEGILVMLIYDLILEIRYLYCCIILNYLF